MAATFSGLVSWGLGVPGQGDVTSFVDNVRVSLVPEPASLSLPGLDGPLTLRRRRRGA